MKKVLALVSVLTFVLVGTVSAGEKVTICHAAGQAGTTHYVELTISENAVYGPGGHFNENGTPQAGHEQDYLGPCETEVEPTPTPEITPSPTPRPSPVASGSVGRSPDPTPALTLPPTDTE